MGSESLNMIVTIFRSRLRPEHREEYERTARRMNGLVRKLPGFLSLKTFDSPEGERVSIIEFASEAAHEAWRAHPAHREAQRLGREKFYSEFSIQVCRIARAYKKPKPQARRTPRTKRKTSAR